MHYVTYMCALLTYMYNYYTAEGAAHFKQGTDARMAVLILTVPQWLIFCTSPCILKLLPRAGNGGAVLVVFTFSFIIFCVYKQLWPMADVFEKAQNLLLGAVDTVIAIASAQEKQASSSRSTSSCPGSSLHTSVAGTSLHHPGGCQSSVSQRSSSSFSRQSVGRSREEHRKTFGYQPLKGQRCTKGGWWPPKGAPTGKKNGRKIASACMITSKSGNHHLRRNESC